MEQSLLQTEASITKWSNFITERGRFYKKGPVLLLSRATSRYYKMGQELLQIRASNILQNEAIVITKWGRYYRVGQLYKKVGQVLQSGADITKSGSKINR